MSFACLLFVEKLQSPRAPLSSQKPGSRINDWKWDWAAPCGAPATEAFLCSHFLSAGNRLQPPWPALNPKGYSEQLLIRDGRGCRDKEDITWGQIKGTREAHKETTWGHVTGVQALLTLWSLSTTLPLNHCQKTTHQIPLFLKHKPTVSPLPDKANKAIKLFFTTSPQTLVSEIQFGTHAQRLEGREVEGEFRTWGTHVYLWPVHVGVWQKPSQYCKVIILQLK